MLLMFSLLDLWLLYLLITCVSSILPLSSIPWLHLQHGAEELLWGLSEEANLSVGVKAVEVGWLSRKAVVNVLEQTDKMWNTSLCFNLKAHCVWLWHQSLRKHVTTILFLMTIKRGWRRGTFHLLVHNVYQYAIKCRADESSSWGAFFVRHLKE